MNLEKQTPFFHRTCKDPVSLHMHCTQKKKKLKKQFLNTLFNKTLSLAWKIDTFMSTVTKS